MDCGLFGVRFLFLGIKMELLLHRLITHLFCNSPQTEGSRQVQREVNHYNLQMIMAVGFKVNNERAVQFRKWANGIVKDYTIKGWVMDDERLKRGTYLTDKYFDEQLERIREIRASERKFYQKITDIYSLQYCPIC